MFLLFSLITVLGALAMLLQKNVIVAGLCLVLAFLGMAGLFLLLANPVAAALQVIVYSGAIMVLVLFTIMLLNSNEEEPAQQERPVQRWAGVALVAAFGAFAVKLVTGSKALAALDGNPGRAFPMTLERVGAVLFDQHLLAFEAAGLLLLAAMVGAVTLVKKDL